MPIAARQTAKIITVPPASSGTSESDNDAQHRQRRAAGAANAEPVQNRAASNVG